MTERIVDASEVIGLVPSKIGELSPSIRDLIDQEQALADAARQWEKAGRSSADTWLDTIGGLSRAIRQFSSDVKGGFGDVVSAVGVTMGALGSYAEWQRQQRKAGQPDSIGALWNSGAKGKMQVGMNVGAAAIAGIGTFMATTERGSTGSQIGHGALAGMQAGAAFGPYGAAIGAAAGAVAGLVRSRFVDKNEREARDLFHGLQDQIVAVATAEQLAISKGDKWATMNQVIVDSFTDIGLGTEDALAAINRVLDATHKSAADVQAAMQNINVALERQKQLKDALAQQKDAKRQVLEAAVQRYGLTFDQAGQGYQMGNLADRSEQLLQYHDALKGSGMQESAILTAMAGDFSTLVQDARRANIDLPNEMRGILAQLRDQRQLVDEHGTPYSADTFIQFSDELKPMFASVLTKLDQLITELRTPIDQLRAPVPQGAPAALPTPTQDSSWLDIQYWLAQGDRMHSGGFIPRAHRGMYVDGGLRHDEVQIIAQTEEGVLNRRATRNVGGEAGINTLNAGGMPNLGGDAPAQSVVVHETTEIHVHATYVDEAGLRRIFENPNVAAGFITNVRRDRNGIRSALQVLTK